MKYIKQIKFQLDTKLPPYIREKVSFFCGENTESEELDILCSKLVT